ncbi:hypothetical protein [Bifidobacterium scaligerum]|uniref:Uncharacterized protein n=1 Tax=Bifidobacterium scaligerum TaxID=2052656 RepID=A0A2M9HP43_9BIFI|nr:hypothetical protein [Bifidobacterium scaligerum]PJM78549.1 hypothetical protein CUU80_08880 [Bifidobacterium scaligerum]
MRIFVNPADVKIVVLDGQKEFEPSKDASGQLRLTDDKPVYALRNIAVKFRGEDGGYELVQNASVKLFRAPSRQLGELEIVQLDGRVRVTPYVNGQNRIGLSIMADGIKEAAK